MSASSVADADTESTKFGLWLAKFVTEEFVTEEYETITSPDMLGFLKQQMQKGYAPDRHCFQYNVDIFAAPTS